MAQRVRPKAKQAASQSISLTGSTQIVTGSSPHRHLYELASLTIAAEFFDFAMSSILYQRGIYPADDFKMVKKFGLNMLAPSEENLRTYLATITDQLTAWLNNRQVSRLVLAIMEKDSREIVERWQFDITLDDSEPPPSGKENQPPEGSSQHKASVTPPSEADVRNQIQLVIKNICASVAFLPVLEQACTFNVLAYTDMQTDVPTAWAESDAHFVQPGSTGSVEHVKLRGFTTSIHRVEGLVAYRLGGDDV